MTNLLPDSPTSEGRFFRVPEGDLSLDAAVASSITVLVALAFFVGWLFDLEFATSAYLGFSPMRPDAAVALFFCGMSLLYLVRSTRAKPGHNALYGVISAVFAVLITGTTLFKCVVGDPNSLISALAEPDAITSPMGPNTAICLLLSSIALILSSRSNPLARRVSWIVMSAVPWLGLLALIGYLYGVPHLFKISDYTEMSFSSSCMVIILSLGYFCYVTDIGPTAILKANTAGGYLARSVLPVCVIVPILLGWLTVEGFRDGLFPGEFGIACFSGLMSLVASLFVFLIANVVNKENYSRQYANALKEAEEKYRSVTQSAHDGIISIDANKNIVATNPAALRIFGTSADELMDHPLSNLIAEKFRGSFDETISKFMGENRDSALAGQTVEVLGQRADGTDFPMETSLSSWGTGADIFVSLVIRDITARKGIENRLNEFYVILAHELRSPLTSIRGTLDLMGTGNINPEQTKELLEISQVETERMLRLINDLLDLKKIEAGDAKLQVKEVRSSELIAGAVAALRGMALESDIQVVSIVEDNVLVKCEKDRVIQVITNILSNALKFSPRDSVIEVKVALMGNKLRFSVKDQGPGMSDVELAALFTKFKQGRTMSTKYTGTGLGLAISKSIVERHGGKIGVDTKEGMGTTFWFDLPYVTQKEDKSGNQKDSLS